MSTSTAAPEMTEWPDEYSGNGGVGNTVVYLGSHTRFTNVTGRTTCERYFSRQHQMNASAIAMEVNAYASTLRSAESCFSATI